MEASKNTGGFYMFYVQQIGKHDCAFTCLEIMLANYHHDRNYLFLKHEDREYSFKELIGQAEAYNLNLIGIKVEETKELFKCQNFPLLVVLKVDEKAFHSVLLLKITKKKAYLFDPSKGKITMKMSEFKDIWTHMALMIKDGLRTTRPEIAPDFISTKDKVTLPFFQILSGLSLLIGSYFIDKDAYIFVPIALFSLFIIFELLFRDNLVKAMRKMDEAINYYTLDDGVDYYSFYVDSEKYRYKALSFYPNVIYSTLISIFLTFVLLLNDPKNSIYVGIAFLLSFIEAVGINPYFRQKELEIMDDEKNIAKCKDESEYREYSSRAREKAYHLGLTRTIITYLGVAILIIAAILIMAISQIINITYIVFFLCVSVFLKNNLSKIFNYAKDSEERDLYRAKIINYLKEEEE